MSDQCFGEMRVKRLPSSRVRGRKRRLASRSGEAYLALAGGCPEPGCESAHAMVEVLVAMRRVLAISAQHNAEVLKKPISLVPVCAVKLTRPLVEFLKAFRGEGPPLPTGVVGNL